MISHATLWQRIHQHAIGGEQQSLLLSKLTSEQNWSSEYSQRALGEYRRFVYLACVSPTPVSPSEAVDAVWHLHLTFSRDYWLVFCPHVLGHSLHHDPSDRADTARMQNQYHATLALYRSEFGQQPPSDIWGEPEIANKARLGHLAQRLGGWLVALGAVLPAGIALASESAGEGNNDGLIAFSALAVVVYVIYRVFRTERPRKRRGKDSGSSCSGGSACSSGSSCGSSCGGGGD